MAQWRAAPLDAAGHQPTAPPGRGAGAHVLKMPRASATIGRFPLPEPAMQIATWNVNSLAVRLPQVLDWLAAHPVDVLALQELKLTDDKFPAAAFAEAGYQAQWFGQKTYNGVALITKTAATDVVKNIPGFEDEMARVITGTCNGVRVIGAYFPNGQAPDSDKFVYKMRWLEALRAWVRSELEKHPRLVLMG